MGTIFVDNLEPQSGTSLTLGASGDTVTLTSGAVQSNLLYPAFHVTRSSNQSIGNSSNTKIQWNNEIVDTNSAFDSSTNYRFTPQVAGKYFIAMHVRLNSSTDAEQCFINIKKNTSDILQSYYKNAYYNGHYGAVFVDLNGSSDYIEFYIHHNIGTSVDLDSNDQNCYAYGFRIGT